MTETPKPPPMIISDQPTTEKVLPEFDEKATAVAEVVERSFEENATRRVIGVFGPWGSGKNFLEAAPKGSVSACKEA